MKGAVGRARRVEQALRVEMGNDKKPEGCPRRPAAGEEEVLLPS